jgi:hypothetical protein
MATRNFLTTINVTLTKLVCVWSDTKCRAALGMRTTTPDMTYRMHVTCNERYTFILIAVQDFNGSRSSVAAQCCHERSCY